MDEDANIVDVKFTKSVIASKEAFTYEAAQRRKDDKCVVALLRIRVGLEPLADVALARRSLTDPLTEGIRMLNSIALKLKAKRMAAGALNLASPEVKIHLESSEQTGPVDVEVKELFETNSLVEEFMLLANISVAQRIYEQFPQTAVLRRHAPPPKTNFEVLQDVLQKRRGFTLDVSTSGALADSLDKCVVRRRRPPSSRRLSPSTRADAPSPRSQDPSFPAFNTLVRIMATRCMLSAEYFCSGSLPASQFSHYGLASPIYTHFTSPIRRYADVLVHRQLAAAISGQPLHAGLQTRAFVEKTLEVVNKRHRGAQGAARASIEFYVALAIQRREEAAQKLALEAVAKAGGDKAQGKVRAEAFVIRAFKNGLAVFVSQCVSPLLLSLSSLPSTPLEEEQVELTLSLFPRPSRFGLEGLVTFKRDLEYDAESYEVTAANADGNKVTIGVFDKVEVEISVEKVRLSRSPLHPRASLCLRADAAMLPPCAGPQHAARQGCHAPHRAGRLARAVSERARSSSPPNAPSLAHRPATSCCNPLRGCPCARACERGTLDPSKRQSATGEGGRVQAGPSGRHRPERGARMLAFRCRGKLARRKRETRKPAAGGSEFSASLTRPRQNKPPPPSPHSERLARLRARRPSPRRPCSFLRYQQQAPHIAVHPLSATTRATFASLAARHHRLHPPPPPPSSSLPQPPPAQDAARDQVRDPPRGRVRVRPRFIPSWSLGGLERGQPPDGRGEACCVASDSAFFLLSSAAGSE